MNNFVFNKYNAKDIIIFLLAVVILALLLTTGGRYDKSYFKGRVVVVFGDSLTAGVGASNASDSYGAYLAQSLGITVVNKGVGGDTTLRALERLQSDVLDLSPRPEIAIVLLGGNDLLDGIPQTETEKNLNTIIEKIQAKGIKVILLGLSNVYFPDYENMFQSIATEKNIGYVRAILDGIINAEDLMNDLKHPNSDGYKLVAQRIEPTLERFLLEEK
ncbi:MAG TPA: GDSL-type esterase/lipase family protein [Candidatus Paceibacterota bacterium]|nr:GDSL-type esterase/lipase family protein [Candidatus Paceibacterota bacterium]HPT40531.1 GDSL-type esterase/lipase family protein [Candidatus Paceibacterota bacterium]